MDWVHNLLTFWNILGIIVLIAIAGIEWYLASKDLPLITTMYQAIIAKVSMGKYLRTVHLALLIIGTIVIMPIPLDGNVKMFIGGIWWHLNLPSKIE